MVEKRFAVALPEDQVKDLGMFGVAVMVQAPKPTPVVKIANAPRPWRLMRSTDRT
jgi:hypothetical protein